MIRLIRAEASRWFARRGLWITALGMIVLMGILVVSIWFTTRPPTPEELQLHQRYYAEAVADWEQNGQRYIDDCKASTTTDADRLMCDQMGPPSESDYDNSMDWENASETVAIGAAAVGALGAMLMTASFWGGEYRQGSLATWLTFVPSRRRVWASKMIVGGLAGAAAVAVCSAIGLIGAWAAISVNQGAGAVGSWTAALLVVLRGAGLGAMFAVIGGALAVGFRNTFAAVALPMGYLFLQGLVGVLRAIPGVDRLAVWMPENNVVAYLDNGYTVWVPVSSVGPDGVVWSQVEKVITFGQGLVYLLVVTAVVALGSWVLFQRRDINE